MFTRFDIITMGDVMIDVFLEMGDKEANVIHTHHPEQNKICFNFADKIPVDRMEKMMAGNACNVAVGSRRLGQKTSYVTIIGKDPEAEMIKQGLKREKIDASYVIADKRTNFSAVINYKGERTIFVYHEPRDYKLPKLSAAKFLYLSSMRPGWEKIVEPMAHYLDRSKTKLAYNPGTYQLRAGKHVSKELLKRTEILFVNKEEAALFVDLPLKDTPEGISTLMSAIHTLGPKTVVITDGPVGSYASDSSGQYFLGIYDVPVIERTGCGDAFATGFMNAIAAGKDTKEAMRWGSFESAAVLQHIGPQAGLLSMEELEKTGRKYRDFNATDLLPHRHKEER